MAGIKGEYIYNKLGEVIGATGGKLAALKNLASDPDFYRKAGKKGGMVKGTASGFASLKVGKDGLSGRERASIKGAIGGTISRRVAKKPTYDFGGNEIK